MNGKNGSEGSRRSLINQHKKCSVKKSKAFSASARDYWQVESRMLKMRYLASMCCGDGGEAYVLLSHHGNMNGMNRNCREGNQHDLVSPFSQPLDFLLPGTCVPISRVRERHYLVKCRPHSLARQQATSPLLRHQFLGRDEPVNPEIFPAQSTREEAWKPSKLCCSSSRSSNTPGLQSVHQVVTERTSCCKCGTE